MYGTPDAVRSHLAENIRVYLRAGTPMACGPPCHGAEPRGALRLHGGPLRARPLGGLFVDDAGGGVALVRAKGRGEAVAPLAADPAIREGVFTGVVRRCHALFNGPEEMGAALSQVRSNKRAVRALFEAVDRRDGEGVRAGYDENITIHEAASLPYGGD